MNLGLTSDQLTLRRSYVCGSDAARVLAGEWRELWREKMALSDGPDLSDVLAVQMGSFTEPLNAYWYEKQTGRAVTRRNEWVASRRYPWMGANLDGVTVTGRGDPAYVDFKHVGKFDEAMVARYSAQCTHNATILNLDWWCLSVFVGNGRWELVEQAVDPLYQAALIAKEKAFWGYVERGEEPPEDQVAVMPPKPQPRLRTILLDELTPGGTDYPNWGAEIIKLFRVFAETKPAADLHAISRKDIAATIPEDVGLVRFGLCEARRDRRGLTVALKKDEAAG